MNNAKRLAEMKEFLSRRKGQLDMQKRQIQRTLKSLKRNYGIETTKAARERKQQIDDQIEKLTAQSEALEAEAEELMKDID